MTEDIHQLAQRLDGLGEELEQAMHSLNRADPIARPGAYDRQITAVEACAKAVSAFGLVIAELLSAPPQIVYGKEMS